MKRAGVLLLFLSLLIGCKKDEDSGNPLSKFRLKEYTHDHYKLTYSYDSLNRLAKTITYYDGDLIFYTNYFYIDNKLDSLIVILGSGPSMYETFKYQGDTIFHNVYRYTSDDMMKDKFVVNDGRVVKLVPPLCSMGDSSFQCHYEVMHWDENNLTYKYVYSNSGSSYPYYKSAGSVNDFPMTNAIWSTYDDHPNPLQSIYNQNYPFQYESSANNLTRMVVSDMQGDTLFRYFTHTYNEYGLPVTTFETQGKNNSVLNEYVHLTTSTSGYVYEEY